MPWWRCVRWHARKNELVSHVVQGWFGIVLTFIFHTSFLWCTIRIRSLNSVRSKKHVGVVGFHAHTRDAKQSKSLASRLDAMKRIPKF